MNLIKTKLLEIKEALPEHVTLVAVSKTKPISELMEAYEAGQRIFGENKILEMADKHENMPKDIKWHMIGHVQTNKVKYMASFVDLIHAVDSFKLLKEINKQAKKHNRTINCLLQIKIAQEESKFGLSESEAIQLLKNDQVQQLSNISIQGLMGMATFTDDKTIIKTEFEKISSLFQSLQATYTSLKTLSIGMSGDYLTAIATGSTMVRIGSSIFGARNYNI